MIQRFGEVVHPQHRDIIDGFSFRPGDEHIEFSLGSIVYEGETRGGFDDEVRRAQIRETVGQHLDRELSLHRQGRNIKVLSLIFVDRVSNYRVHTLELCVSNTWRVQDAEARFGEMLDTALRDGPQIVIRQGVEAAAVISIERWRRLESAAEPTLKDLLLAPDPRDESLVIPRRRLPRREPLQFD